MLEVANHIPTRQSEVACAWTQFGNSNSNSNSSNLQHVPSYISVLYLVSAGVVTRKKSYLRDVHLYIFISFYVLFQFQHDNRSSRAEI